jgi:hypothetical protein
MPALVAGIHVLLAHCKKDVDGRDKPGHDVESVSFLKLKLLAAATDGHVPSG